MKKEMSMEILSSLSKEHLKQIILKLAERHDIGEDLKSILQRNSLDVPSFAFNKRLSGLESICKYLKEDLGLSFHEIALILNRDDRTIWTTYKRAKKKMEKRFSGKSIFYIPCEIFKNRRLSVLENIVKFLKEEYDFNFHKIANVLERDDRTIWTVFNRAMKKIGKK